VTISFVPDGTVLGNSNGNPITSNLFATFNGKFGSASAWQTPILKAAQLWAQQTNLNFAVVSDNGGNSGSGSYQQGDPSFGDIRIGGYNFGTSTLALGYMPPPVNNYSIAGDVVFNMGAAWSLIGIGGNDLQTVAEHEIGHALGLNHTTATLLAVMWPSYTTTKHSLNNDDVQGIQAIYSSGAARAQDANDAAAANGTFATATSLTSLVNPTTLTALATGLDLTTTSDVDYYSVVVPSGTSGTLTLNVQSSGLSLLSPKVTVYASDQTTVLGSANGLNQYGTTLSVTVNSLSAGQTLYVKVQGADTTANSTGAYAMTLNFGTGASPTVPLPNTQLANGSPPSSGGGIADTPQRDHNGSQENDDNGGGHSGELQPQQGAQADFFPDLDEATAVQATVQTSQPVLAVPQTLIHSASTSATPAAGNVLTAIPGAGFRPEAVFVASQPGLGAPAALVLTSTVGVGGGNALPAAADQEPAPVVPEAVVPASVDDGAAPSPKQQPMATLSPQACDACFADQRGLADSDPEMTTAVLDHGGTAIDPAVAAASLAVLLGGCWHTVPEDPHPKRRQRAR